MERVWLKIVLGIVDLTDSKISKAVYDLISVFTDEIYLECGTGGLTTLESIEFEPVTVTEPYLYVKAGYVTMFKGRPIHGEFSCAVDIILDKLYRDRCYVRNVIPKRVLIRNYSKLALRNLGYNTECDDPASLLNGWKESPTYNKYTGYILNDEKLINSVKTLFGSITKYFSIVVNSSNCCDNRHGISTLKGVSASNLRISRDSVWSVSVGVPFK